MNALKLSRQLMWAILIALLLVGCGSFTDATIPAIEVTFDGNKCTVSGATEVTRGVNSIVLIDLSGEIDDLQALHLLDGHTYQDLIDLQGGPGKNYTGQSWIVQSMRIGKKWNESIGGDVYTFYLQDEGEYSIVVAKLNPIKVWFCAPLKVIEAPSE